MSGNIPYNPNSTAQFGTSVTQSRPYLNASPSATSINRYPSSASLGTSYPATSSQRLAGNRVSEAYANPYPAPAPTTYAGMPYAGQPIGQRATNVRYLEQQQQQEEALAEEPPPPGWLGDSPTAKAIGGHVSNVTNFWTGAADHVGNHVKSAATNLTGHVSKVGDHVTSAATNITDHVSGVAVAAGDNASALASGDAFKRDGGGAWDAAASRQESTPVYQCASGGSVRAVGSPPYQAYPQKVSAASSPAPQLPAAEVDTDAGDAPPNRNKLTAGVTSFGTQAYSDVVEPIGYGVASPVIGVVGGVGSIVGGTAYGVMSATKGVFGTVNTAVDWTVKPSVNASADVVDGIHSGTKRVAATVGKDKKNGQPGDEQQQEYVVRTVQPARPAYAYTSQNEASKPSYVENPGPYFAAAVASPEETHPSPYRLDDASKPPTAYQNRPSYPQARQPPYMQSSFPQSRTRYVG